MSSNQTQTSESFSFKWQKRATYESETVQQEWRRWLLEKYFDGHQKNLDELLEIENGADILDVGCGAAGSILALFGDALKNHRYVGVDISESIEVAKTRFNERNIPGSFFRYDLNFLPPSLGQFDIIFAEGVLHHTDSVKDAIHNLTKHLKLGGRFLFYVYVKKAPIREFTDDFVRDRLRHLDNSAAWDELIPLTKLGKILGDLNIEIDIEDDIHLLEIPKGRYNLQRLFFYKICKAYYQDNYTIDEMNHVNFDWFRPLNCHRHTPDEIQSFCVEAGLCLKRMKVEESGITVIGQRL